jgi:hypothetical protein
MSELSVHDNRVYAYSVLGERGEITLHTMFDEKLPVEYTDVVFRGVLAHHFECSLQGNILFDVDEVELKTVLEENAALIERLKNYGWPPIEYTDLKDLERALRESGTHAYQIDSSYGLSGFVFALSMECIKRASKAFA